MTCLSKEIWWVGFWLLKPASPPASAFLAKHNGPSLKLFPNLPSSFYSLDLPEKEPLGWIKQ